MKQEISALMDGELSEEDANAIFDKLKRNPEAHEEWATYHLISEVLRQPDRVQTNIHMAIRDRLQDEPTVLAPPGRPRQDSRWFTLSAAASVMAFTFAAWLLVQNGSEPTRTTIALQQSTVAESTANSVDDYLRAHQEVSPSLDVYSMNSYVHTAVPHHQGDQ